jgi:hypothetical protein
MSDRLPNVALVVRTVAVLIALAGVVDPALTRARTSTPAVALVHDDAPEHVAAAASIRARLTARGAQVVDAAGPHDAARVVIGAPPVGGASGDIPTFLFAPSPVSVTDVGIPSRVRLTSRVPVRISLAAAEGGTARVELLDEGRAVAHDTVALTAGGGVVRELSWAPSALGIHALTVRVSAGSAPPRRVTRAVLVDSTRWRVLAYDARPSWNATFVRRALERDGRFDVRSRVVATRTPQTVVARATPRAPVSLGSLDPRTVDVVVIGAPEALPAADVSALRRLVSEQGVAAVLLPDEATPAVTNWLGTSPWRTTPRREAVALPGVGASDTTATLRALVVAAPVSLPAGSDALVRYATQPVVWRQPIGVGEVVVNGALDAWRFREPAQSAFDTFWRDVVATEAARRAPTVSAWPEALSLATGKRPRLRITAPSAPTARWRAQRGADISLPVTPTSDPSSWSLLPPADTGRGTLVIAAAGDSVVVPWVVTPDAAAATDLDPPFAAAWANTLGGAVVRTPDALVTAVMSAAQAHPEPLPWHPMRSPWWMLPFALAVGGEWWLRRRAGHP